MFQFPSAADAYFGSSVKVTMTGDIAMARRVRLYDVNPDAGGHRMFLPEPRHGHALVEPRWQGNPGGFVFAIHNRGAFDVDVVTADGLTTVCTVAAGKCDVVHLIDDTGVGTWFADSDFIVQRTGARSAGLSGLRIPMLMTCVQSNVTTDVPTFLEQNLGWDGTSPVALTIVVPDGITIGASTRFDPALQIVGLPASSTCLLLCSGTITGRGGNGGRGGFPTTLTAPTAGQAGGPAVKTDMDLAVANYGVIQGGGGGGGGGGYYRPGTVADASGGGGGGGAGWSVALGGAGFPSGPGGTPIGSEGGQPGSNVSGGLGGAGGPNAGAGGNGGIPGSAGAAGATVTVAGGAGGTGGNYMLRATGRTVTWIVNGTRSGTEATY